VFARERRDPLSLIKKIISTDSTSNSQRSFAKRNKVKMNLGYSNKENINNFATQARSYESLQQQHPDVFRSVQSKQHLAATEQPRLQKKSRSVKNNRCETTLNGQSSSNEVNTSIERPMNKVPVDPPGAVLGAISWMPPNQAFNDNNLYQGHTTPFASMASWAFQPVPNVGHIHGWTMPPFLAPLAASVRHPFNNFVPNHNSRYYGNYHPTRHNVEVEEEEEEQDDCNIFNPISTNKAVAALKGESDVKMDDAAVSFNLPSTFAPENVVETIRSRRLIDNLVDVKSPLKCKPTQNRVLTRSAARALKKNSSHTAAMPHQAASPMSSQGDSSSKCDGVCPHSQIMTVLGKRVTMIDLVKKIFIIDLLSPEQCDEIRRMADDHTHKVHESGSNTEVWSKLHFLFACYLMQISSH